MRTSHAGRLSTGRRLVPALGLATAALVLLGGCGTTLSSTQTNGLGAIGPAGTNDLGRPTAGAAPQAAAGAQIPTTSAVGSGAVGAGAAGGPAGSTVGPGTGAASGTPGAVGSPGSGVSSPLKIGLTYIDNAASSAALGVSTSSSLSAKSVAEAYVRGINAHGGIDGRKLVAVEYSFNGDANNYSSEATAACQLFTQDNHVSVVLDNAFGTTGGFRQCLQSHGVLDIGDQDEGDQPSSSAASLHVNTLLMTTDRTYSAVLTQMAATGYLSRSNQLGIIVEACPEDTGPYAQTLLPLIGRLGLKKPREAQINCTTGFSSAGSAAATISNSILAFRQAGVDRVMFVSYEESVVLLLFSEDANSQGYKPGYLLSSYAQPALAPSNIPSGQWPQLHGVGNSPINDVANPGRTAVEAHCLRLDEDGGASPANNADDVTIIFECGPFLLLEGALGASGGVSSAQVLASEIDAMGSSFAAPGVVANASYFSSTRHDGPDMVRDFTYSAGCRCVSYTSRPVAAPA